MDRRLWMAMLAKLVTPNEAVDVAPRLCAMIPLLKGYPDAMFVEESAEYVARYGRVRYFEDVVTYHPLTRTPSYGELEEALGRWWREHRAHSHPTVLPASKRLEAPVDPYASQRAQAHADWSDPANIRAALRSLEGHPARMMCGKYLGGLIYRHARHNMSHVPPEFMPEDYVNEIAKGWSPA